MLLSDPRHHKLRTAVLIMAIMASVSLSVMMSSLSVGLATSTRASLNRVKADAYIVPKDLNPLLLDLQRFDQGHMVIRELEASPYPPDRSAPRLSDTLFMDIDGEAPEEVLAIGVAPSSERGFGQFRTVDGGWFTNLSDGILDRYQVSGNIGTEDFSREVLISERIAREQGLSPGDTIYLRPSSDPGTRVPFNIVGTYVNELSRLDRSILLKLGELQFWRGGLKRDSMTEILLAYHDEGTLRKVIGWAASDDFLFRDIVEIEPKGSILGEVREFTILVDAFSLAVVVSTALVCLFFTTTLFSIIARRQAWVLATTRALGLPLFRVMLMALREAIYYFSAGAFIATLVCIMAVRSLDRLLTDRLGLLPSTFQLFVLDPALIVVTWAGALLLGSFAVLVPLMVSSFRPATLVLKEASD